MDTPPTTTAAPVELTAEVTAFSSLTAPALPVPTPDGNDSLRRAILESAVGLSFEDVFPHIMTGFAVVEYSLMVLIVLSNAFILGSYVIGRARVRANNSCLRLPSSGRLVLNLALADLLVGLGLIYFSIFKFWPEMAAILARYKIPCLLRFAICFLSMFGSHCALLVVALDRYAAIVHTLHYKDFMTTRVSWCFILGGWFVPVVGSSSLFLFNQWRPDVPFCDEHYVVPQFIACFAMPSNVFIILAVSITHWRVHKEVKAFTLRCADPQFVASGASRRSHGCRKSAQVLLRVTTTFLVCWTPLDVMLLMFVMVGPELWLLVVFETAFLLAMTSFLLNPLVYAWQTEAIRRPLMDALVTLGVLRSSVLAVLSPRTPGYVPRGVKDARVYTIAHASTSILSVSQSSSSGATVFTACPSQTAQPSPSPSTVGSG